MTTFHADPCECVRGSLGRHDGEIVYCHCRDGLDAQMVTLAAYGLHVAYAIETLAALDRRRGLLQSERDNLTFFSFEFRINQGRYDALQAEWKAMR